MGKLIGACAGMKKKMAKIIPLIIMLVIILLPLPADDLYIHFHIKEGALSGYRLYYATEECPVFTEDRYVDSDFDEKNSMISFKLDNSLEGKITGLRLDLLPKDDCVSMDSVSLNSGGLIVKRWSVTKVFSEKDLLMVNGVVVQTVPSREIVYFFTTENDPYVVFSGDAVAKLSGAFSHKALTKICIALLIGIGAFFYNKDLFGKEVSEEISS